MATTTGMEISSDIRINENLRLLSDASISKDLQSRYTSNLSLKIGVSYQMSNFELTPQFEMYQNITNVDYADLLIGLGCSYQID